MTLMTVCVVSCVCNKREARRIRKVAKEYRYTGFDTLIRIDGYYYREHFDITEVVREHYPDNRFRITWIIFSKSGGFKGGDSFFRTHDELQDYANSRPYNGYYTVVGDTIKAKGHRKFQLGMWNLFEVHYLIENDSTIRRILTTTIACPDNRVYNQVLDNVYKFREYKFDAK